MSVAYEIPKSIYTDAEVDVALTIMLAKGATSKVYRPLTCSASLAYKRVSVLDKNFLSSSDTQKDDTQEEIVSNPAFAENG